MDRARMGRTDHQLSSLPHDAAAFLGKADAAAMYSLFPAYVLCRDTAKIVHGSAHLAIAFRAFFRVWSRIHWIYARSLVWWPAYV